MIEVRGVVEEVEDWEERERGGLDVSGGSNGKVWVWGGY